MTKAEIHSIERCRELVPFIIELATLEQKGESAARRKRLVRAHEYLMVHVERLGINAGSLGRYYDPGDYVEIAKTVLSALS